MASSRLVYSSGRHTLLSATHGWHAQRAFVTSAVRLLATEAPPSSTSAAAAQKTNAKQTQPSSSHVSPLSPSAPPPKAHSALTVKLVKTIAKLLGYNTTTSTAIRVTSELYDRCAERADIEAEFWYRECGLPRTYQSWFQITNLHIHLLLTRFRALMPASKAHAYSQELINHYFIDAESRMRMRFGVQTSRLVKGYLREMHAQQRGALLGMDEALSYSAVADKDPTRFGEADAALAAAFWRNLWGAAGWGKGVGGVKRKLKGVDRLTEEEKAALAQSGRKASSVDEVDGLPDLALDAGLSAVGRGDAAALEAQDRAKAAAAAAAVASLSEPQQRRPTDSLEFAVVLQRLVYWYRRETVRLANIPNADIERGRVGGAAAVQESTMEGRIEHLREAQSVANFTRI